MSVVLEGWLRKTDPPTKIAGISIGHIAKRRYCILKSNGDFVMMETQPEPEDEIYSPPRKESYRPALGRGALSISACALLKPRKSSISNGSPITECTVSRTFSFPHSIPQPDDHSSEPSSPLISNEVHQPLHDDTKGQDLELSYRSVCSVISNSDGEGPNAESNSDTDTDPIETTPPAAAPVSAPASYPMVDTAHSKLGSSTNLKSRSFLDSLTSLNQKQINKKVKPVILRLDHAVVTCLPHNRISLLVDDFQKVYILQTETAESKTEWFTALQRVCSEHAISLEDIAVKRCIGAGGFGRVFQVELRHNKRTYAMKVMDKAFLYNKDALDEVLNEVAILQSLRHPFIARLYYSFQTGDKLCMLMDFLAGGELFTLTQHTLFPEEVVRLHAAQISLALDYLHEQGIVYRDLKPENIVLDAEANCVLTDFGLAHRFGNERLGVLAGSLTYMAPELLIPPPNVTKSVDWWALGCLIFEVTTGRHPFMDEQGEVDPQKVLEEEPQLEDTQGVIISDLLKHIVRQFLIKAPAHRLQDLPAIQQHPWFTGMDWVAVYNREVRPMYRGMPWKPRVTNGQKFDANATAQGTHVGCKPMDAAEYHLDGFDWASTEILTDTPSLSAAHVAKGRSVHC